MDSFAFVSLSCNRSGDLIRNNNGSGYCCMGRKYMKKIKQAVKSEIRQREVEPTRYEKNKASFIAIQYHWETVKIGYLRELEGGAKSEIERIYREELDQSWLPNRYCKGCYFNAVQDLIYHFKL